MYERLKRWILGPPLAALIGIESYRVAGIGSRKDSVFFSVNVADGTRKVIHVPLSEVTEFLEARERHRVAAVNAKKVLPYVLATPFMTLGVVYLILRFVIWR